MTLRRLRGNEGALMSSRASVRTELPRFGADFPGGMAPERALPPGSPDRISGGVHCRGWSDRELKLLAGENLLRVMEQAEKVAER